VVQPQSAPIPLQHYGLVRRNLRWIVAGLLCIVTMINYIDRQTMSFIKPMLSNPKQVRFVPGAGFQGMGDNHTAMPLEEKKVTSDVRADVQAHPGQWRQADGLGMTDQEYSYITSAFLLAYVLANALSGIVMDKLGTRIGFALILTWWSIATICHRFSIYVLPVPGQFLGTLVVSFAFWRIMLGLGEAGNWPGAIKSIAEWFPARERGMATGIFNLGSSVGAMIAPPLVIWLYITFGWRNTFLLAGAIGFLWLIGWLLFYRLPRQHPLMTQAELTHIESGQESTAREERTAKLPWLKLLGYRQVWGILIPRALSEPVWWFYLFWLPDYLVRERGVSLKSTALLAALPYILAGFGCLIGGGASSLLMRQGWSLNKARKTVMVASAFLMPVALFVTGAKSPWMAVALVSVATFAHQSWSTNMLILPADLFPQRVVASVTGIGGVGIIASLAGQLAIGYAVAHASYAPVFVIAGLLHPTAAIMMLLLVGRIRHTEIA
jgi:ACS family hexuronate transporter-like MFS transporter